MTVSVPRSVFRTPVRFARLLVAKLGQYPLFRNILAAFGGNSVFFVLQAIRNLLIARLLTPTSFGAWNLGLVLVQYAQWSQLGVLNAFRLEAPRSRGADDPMRLASLRRLTWTMSTLPSTLISLVALAVAHFLPDQELRQALLVLGFVLVPLQIYQYANSYLSTQERFGLSARLQSVLATVNIVLTLAMGYAWGFWGILGAQVVSYGLVLLVYRKDFGLFTKPLFNRPLLLEQMRVGFPFLLTGFSYSLFLSTDRLVVASTLGIAALGQYALTSMARSSIGLIPAAISEVVYMRASYHFGSSQMKDPPTDMMLRFNLGVAYGSAIPIGLSVILVAPFVTLVLPKYQDGILPLQIFMVGLFFAFPLFGGMLLTIVNRAIELAVISGIITGLQFALAWLIIPRFGLEGAAAVTVVSSAALFAVTNWWGLRRFIGELRTIGHVAECCLPWVWMLVTMGVSFMAAQLMLGAAAGALGFLLTSLVFVLLMGPLVFWGSRRLIGSAPAALDKSAPRVR